MGIKKCPNCGHPIDDYFPDVCPNCRTPYPAGCNIKVIIAIAVLFILAAIWVAIKNWLGL
ncbi:hypothetical protein ACFLT1_02655 [Bacteroidota bacterium]